jgi:hypothetical protein
MTEHDVQPTEAKNAKGARVRFRDSAMKSPRRLPDKPWKYNPPAPADAVRPKPVVVPKAG